MEGEIDRSHKRYILRREDAQHVKGVGIFVTENSVIRRHNSSNSRINNSHYPNKTNNND